MTDIPGMERPLVLLVGFRAGIIRAAERVGVDLAVLDRRAPKEGLVPRLAGMQVVDWGCDPAELERAAHRAVGRRVPAAVLALTEGAVLPAGRLRALFGAPGSTLVTAERCSNKIAMKRAIRAAGLPCADFEPIGPESDADELVRRLGLPMVLKHAESSGSRGLVMARTVEEVRASLATHDLAERLVDGVEMSVEGFYRGGVRLFASTTRYLVPLHANVVPSGVDPGTLASVLTLMDDATSALGVAIGVTHMEVFLTADGPLFGELGARPPGGRLMPLIQRAWGFDPYEALLRIVLGRDVTFPAAPRCASGTWLLHPGEGQVTSIDGVEAARSLPGVRKVELRLAIGDRIAKREGSGQDVGHIDVESPTPQEASDQLTAARGAITIGMLAG